MPATIISISNQKGGVGKTTLTINIGKILADRGFSVLLVDNDPQGNLTSSIFGKDIPSDVLVRSPNQASRIGVSHTNNLYIGSRVSPFAVSKKLSVIGSTIQLSNMAKATTEDAFNFKDNLLSVSEGFDFVLIDCLPSFGVMQTAAHATADYLIIPTHLEEFSVSAVAEQVKTAYSTKRHMNQKLEVLAIVANEVSGTRLVVEDYFSKQLLMSYDEKFTPLSITKSTKVREAHALNMSITEYNPRCKQAVEYSALVDELLQRMER